MKENVRKLYAIIFTIVFTGCAVQNQKFFSSVQETEDVTYGYIPENPIEIKNADLGTSINSSYYYISRLITEKGNELEVIQRFSVKNPNYKKPAFPLTNRYTGQPLSYGTGPLLDRWILRADKDTIEIFTNPYKKGEVKVPNGLKFEQEEEMGNEELVPPNFSEIEANIKDQSSEF